VAARALVSVLLLDEQITRERKGLCTEKTGGSWSCEDMTIVLLHAKVSRF
jgi:hypothetical protein